VVIDETAFHSSAIPLRAYSPRGSRLFRMHRKGSGARAALIAAIRFQMRAHHRSAQRERRRIDIARIALQRRYSFRCLFHHVHARVPQNPYAMEQRALERASDSVLAMGILQRIPVIIRNSSMRGNGGGHRGEPFCTRQGQALSDEARLARHRAALGSDMVGILENVTTAIRFKFEVRTETLHTVSEMAIEASIADSACTGNTSTTTGSSEIWTQTLSST
jgi:hypothetical protein